MTGNQMLAQLRGRQAAHLRACFPHLAERDLMLLLCSTPPQAISVLQQCFGYDWEDAKAAWNDFVLRYIDGAPAASQQQAGHSESPVRLL